MINLLSFKLVQDQAFLWIYQRKVQHLRVLLWQNIDLVELRSITTEKQRVVHGLMFLGEDLGLAQTEANAEPLRA